MTEQEALNSPEMKAIMLLSGYVRELNEGKDYEETTYKLAETLVKVFSNREMLIAFKTWEVDNDIKNLLPEQIVDFYLSE